MGEKQEPDIRDSNPNASGPDRAAGGMGVSSERTGPAGPGQDATDGVRDVTPAERADEDGADTPPEQRPGKPEENPEGLPPKSGYSSVDPRSKD
jgi:hypothetical protein